MKTEPQNYSERTPMYRPAARVVLIDPSDRVLLFRVDLRDRPLWITPGGGLEAGESFEEAARRELREETGISAELGPCVWVRRHVFQFTGPWMQDGGETQGVWIDEVEQFFVARADAGAEISKAEWLPYEHKFMTEHRWWSADELAASEDYFAPRALAQLLPALLRGEFPRAPIDCGV